jgi:hypothetical protein
MNIRKFLIYAPCFVGGHDGRLLFLQRGLERKGIATIRDTIPWIVGCREAAHTGKNSFRQRLRQENVVSVVQSQDVALEARFGLIYLELE